MSPYTKCNRETYSIRAIRIAVLRQIRVSINADTYAEDSIIWPPQLPSLAYKYLLNIVMIAIWRESCRESKYEVSIFRDMIMTRARLSAGVQAS